MYLYVNSVQIKRYSCYKHQYIRPIEYIARHDTDFCGENELVHFTKTAAFGLNELVLLFQNDGGGLNELVLFVGAKRFITNEVVHLSHLMQNGQT